MGNSNVLLHSKQTERTERTIMDPCDCSFALLNGNVQLYGTQRLFFCIAHSESAMSLMGHIVIFECPYMWTMMGQ